MTTIFESVTPRADVLSGQLTDATFAANLEQVVSGTAEASYGDPVQFFTTSYPSAGMRATLDEVMGRVSGKRPDAAPVVRLAEALGGGKTHVLIGVFHLATADLDPKLVGKFVNIDLLPDKPVEQIAVMVGATTGASSFPAVHGVSAHTAWGYLALQIGGLDAYDIVKQADIDMVAPGSDAFSQVMDGKPTLILIDELALYLRAASGKTVGSTTLARQTTAFLMSMMEAVSEKGSRSALVLTSTRTEDAFGDETQAVFDAIKEAESVIARKEHAIKPAEEADLPEILARRLFEPVSDTVRHLVAQAYSEAAREATDQGADLADRYQSGEWQEEVARCYPFHPDLVTVFDKRLSTIPNFQRTRGALRILAKTVRVLWADKPADTQLLHLHHIDLADSSLREDLSSRLDRPKWEPVIRRDVASGAGGEPSLAEQIDSEMGATYARKLATTIYLWSLTRDTPGVSVSSLLGSVLAPGDDPNLMAKALDRLSATCWYLHPDATHGYRFSTEANLNRLLAEAMNRVTVAKVKNRATDIAAKKFKDGSGLKVRLNWLDGAVPDNEQEANLIVFHWDDFGNDHGVIDTSTPPKQVTDLWENKPAGGNREFRNRLVFLCPTADTHTAMLDTIREQLAYDDLAASDSLRSLSEDQQGKVADGRKEADLKATVAVCNHLNLLFYPSSVTGFTAVVLPHLTTAKAASNQTDSIFEALDSAGKVLRSGTPPLDPGQVKAALGARLDAAGLTTSELLRFFGRRGDMKVVFDRAQVNTLVSNGIRRGAWDYFDATLGDKGWSTKNTPPAATRLGDDTYLYPPGSAPAAKAPAAETQSADDGIDWDDDSTPKSADSPNQFTATGKAGIAASNARDQAIAAGRATARAFSVKVNILGDTAAEALARLLTILPNPGVPCTIAYDLEAGVALSALDASKYCKVEFHGTADDYKALANGLKNLLTGRDANLNGTVTVTFDPALSIGEQATGDLIQRCKDTGPDSCTLTITTETDA